MEYTIGQISNLLNLPQSTIRYYDKEGLIPFINRKKSGQRVFSQDDLNMLELIECLKKTGMSIKDIKHYCYLCTLGDETLEQRLQMFIKQKEIVHQQQKDLQKTLDKIEWKCTFYQEKIKERNKK